MCSSLNPARTLRKHTHQNQPAPGLLSPTSAPTLLPLPLAPGRALGGGLVRPREDTFPPGPARPGVCWMLSGGAQAWRAGERPCPAPGRPEAALRPKPRRVGNVAWERLPAPGRLQVGLAALPRLHAARGGRGAVSEGLPPGLGELQPRMLPENAR